MHGVIGDADDPAVNETVACEQESLHLHLDRLAPLHKADVLVLHHGFDFQLVLIGNDHEQLLCRRDDAPHGMHGKLLDLPVKGRRQPLQGVPLPSFDELLGQRSSFRLGVGQFGHAGPLKLGHKRPVVFLRFGDRRRILPPYFLLTCEFLRLLNTLLLSRQILHS